MMLGAMFALVLALSQAASDAPLQPKGKWTVGYENDYCVASRAYTVDGGEFAVGIRPVTWGDVIDVVVVQPGFTGPEYRLGSGSLSVDGRPPVTGRVRSWATGTRKARIVALELPRAELQAIAGAKLLRLSADGRDLRLAQAGSAAVAKALATCEADLERSQYDLPRAPGSDDPITPGVSKAAGAAGDPAQWITWHDYPAEAVRLRLQGTTAARWVIGTDGKVSRCWITQRSDHPSLDAAVCWLLQRRGRYQPARDADGKPVQQIATRRVVWRLQR